MIFSIGDHIWGKIRKYNLFERERIQGMDVKKIEEIQGAIKRHQEAVRPAGHNRVDEDMAKVATAEPIGKSSDPTEELRK